MSADLYLSAGAFRSGSRSSGSEMLPFTVEGCGSGGGEHSGGDPRGAGGGAHQQPQEAFPPMSSTRLDLYMPLTPSGKLDSECRASLLCRSPRHSASAFLCWDDTASIVRCNGDCPCLRSLKDPSTWVHGVISDLEMYWLQLVQWLLTRFGNFSAAPV